jgi:hypothetical protein
MSLQSQLVEKGDDENRGKAKRDKKIIKRKVGGK